jgi:hypothetical protein
MPTAAREQFNPAAQGHDCLLVVELLPDVIKWRIHVQALSLASRARHKEP